jgi:Peptidase family M23
MKLVVKVCVLILLITIPARTLAQNDSLKLLCPLNEATIVPPPQNQMKWDQEDLCIVLVSSPDTVVKAVGAGRITNIEYTEESGNGIVLYCRVKNKEYYIWYTGMTKVLVKRNDVIKPGQAIGYLPAGERLEVTMYEFETPVDPLRHLNCRHRVLRGF